MTKTVEIFAAHVGKGVAATALVDQYNTNKTGFSLINQCAQTSAAVASVASITTITTGFMPFLSLSAHVLPGTTTLLKIVAEFNTDDGPDRGDILNLVGNVAGVVGSIVLLGGITAGATPLAFAAITIGGFSILNSDVAKSLYDAVILPFWEKNFKDQPNATYPDHWIAPDLKLVPLSEIQTYYENNIAMVMWDPATDAISIGKLPWEQAQAADSVGESEIALPAGVLVPATCLPPPTPDIEPDPAPEDSSGPEPAGGGGSAVSGVLLGFDPLLPAASGSSGAGQGAGAAVGPGSSSSSANQSSGPQGSDVAQPAPTSGSGDGSDPALGVPAPPPQPGDATIKIGIEVVNGGPESTPVEATYKVDEPTPDEPPEPQDNYGCCTGSQDSYS